MRIKILCLLLLAAVPAFSQKEDKQLSAKLKPLLDAHRGVAGVYVHHLKKDKFVAINADTVFPTASMIKTTITVGVFDKIAKGELKYDSLLEYKDSLLYAGEDILGSFKSGEKIALSKVMMLMLTMSDNTASLWLQSLAGGGAAINSWLEEHGFAVTRVNSRTPGRRENQQLYGWGQTSPREMARLMEMIYRGAVISPAISDRIYRNLTRNFWDGQGLQQVPNHVRTASKNGAVNESRSEVIMVNAPHGDYVYCIITKDNKDQRWTKNNEALVLLRAVGYTIWKHYEKDGNWRPIPVGDQL
ncbi:class A beta-lactamase-related serine hydrolase [Chitinophaga sedimenti]|uniref:serine hydrolase n=1 Tax=Chitinophaga sedimenti TaxID=2033606 RepID=UPI002002C392|nr:serine hydrolase [Chitinophaga sedimenti]MCK7554576.1 class A beta-lactamase-related serine hydrolase [Chitinophaga sedimenti]